MICAFILLVSASLCACANIRDVLFINNTLAGMLLCSVRACEFFVPILRFNFGLIKKGLGCFARKALCPLADFAPGECMTMPGNIKCDVNGSITTLSLNNCSLVGTLPTDIAKLTTLTALILSRNSLKGPITPVFSTLIHLRILRLFGNDVLFIYLFDLLLYFCFFLEQFTGDVPPLPVASLTECRIQDPVLAGNCINVATCPTECICNATAADATCGIVR